jgi:hypothetical protein
MSQACLLNFLPVKQCVKTLENLNVDVGLCLFLSALVDPFLSLGCA